MSHFITRAPGKLFLLGEYAVLDGSAAIVAAVDRYVEVSVQTTANARVSISSDQSPELLEFAAGQTPSDGGFYHLTLCAYRVCLERYPNLARRGLDIRINSVAGFVAGSKIGFGSSAAVTTALVAALRAVVLGTKIVRDHVFELALQAHRLGQQGFGSGADVAASVFGSVVIFRPRRHALPLVTVLPAPRDCKLLAAWSGQPASSVDLVQRYLALQNGKDSIRQQFVIACSAAVEQFAQALTDDNISMEAVAANQAALEVLATHANLPIMTPTLRQFVAIARSNGLAAKISGAGGGDCGVAIVHDSLATGEIREAWSAGGLTPLDIGISEQGVSVEQA